MKPKTLLKLLLSVAVLAFVVYNAGLAQIGAELKDANLWFIPLGIGIYVFSQGVSSFRWQFLCRPLGFNLSLRSFFELYMLGMYFNLFLPGAIGGDALRVYYLAKQTQRKKREATLTLLAERGMGLVVLLLLTGAMCLLPQTQAIPGVIRYGVLALCALIGLGFAGLHLIPTKALLARFPKLALLGQGALYWKNIPLLLQSVAISLLVHGSMVLVHWLCASAFGLTLDLAYLTATYGLVTLASAIPLFFNGIGVREYGYQYFLAKAGIEPHIGLAFAAYWFVISTCTSLLGGIVFIKGHYQTPSPDEMETTQAEST